MCILTNFQPPPQLSSVVLCCLLLTVWVGVVAVYVPILPSEDVGVAPSSQECSNSWVALGVRAQHHLLVFLGRVWEEGYHRLLGTHSRGFQSCSQRWGVHLGVDIGKLALSSTCYKFKNVASFPGLPAVHLQYQKLDGGRAWERDCFNLAPSTCMKALELVINTRNRSKNIE